MRRFEHDGIRFAYRDAGDGPPFAFQHGLGGDAAQPASLCRSAVRLVTLECRGHGDTEPLGPEEALSFATFAADLAALLDHLGLEEVVLGGVSMGAGVALALALAQPARVRGLALVRPAWVDRGSPENLRAYPLIAALLRAHGRRGREAFAASEEYALVRARSPASAASLLGQFDRPGAVARAAVLERLAADAPVAPGAPWGALAMPALVVATEGDPVHPLRHARAIAERLPAARVAVVAGKDAGEERHRREVAAAIDEHLATLR